jgi:hypothetical protein
MDWIELAQDKDMWWALVNAAKNLRIQLNAGNSSTSLEPVIISRMMMFKVVGTIFISMKTNFLNLQNATSRGRKLCHEKLIHHSFYRKPACIVKNSGVFIHMYKN